MIVVDFRSPDSFRAYARFDDDRVVACRKSSAAAAT